MGHAQWTFISGAKESQGVDGQGTRGLHQNQHTYSCKSYQRISVLVIEVIFKPQNIAKVPNSDTHTVQIPSFDHIHTIHLQLKKERSDKKSEASIVSRIIKLDSSETRKRSAVPPPLSKSDIRFWPKRGLTF